jgi:hypothetical protein
MSAFVISYKGRAKIMRPVQDAAEYRKLRDSIYQKKTVRKIREGEEELKRNLLQMNYSCLPNENGTLKGSKTPSNSVGMDVDFVAPENLSAEEKQAWLQEKLSGVPELVLAKKDELGLLMLERSATKGYHLVFKRKPDLSQEGNLRWASLLLGVKYDEGAKDITRVFFTTTASEEDLIYLSEELFDNEETRSNVDDSRHCERSEAIQGSSVGEGDASNDSGGLDCFVPRNDGNGDSQLSTDNSQLSTPDDRTRFIAKGVMKEKNLKASDFLTEGGRHTTVKIFLGGVTQLLTKAETNGILAELMPEHWNDENIQQLVNDFYANYTNPTQRLFKYQEQLFTQSQRLFGGEVSVASRHCERSEAIQGRSGDRSGGLDCFVVPPRNDENGAFCDNDAVDGEDEDELSTVNSQLSTKKMPQGVKESIEAVGPQLAMPVVTAICPCIGALATGVQLDVHGQKRGLNLIAYIAGDFASGKGKIDPVVDAWMSEVVTLDKMYQMQEDEWRAKKRAAKNKKDQPEEPKLPVRCLTLNNTVANLAERLANTEGKHAFSFTPEADTVAQKWKSTLSDFSIMLRQSYDGTKYEREARSADAVNVHIEKLLWNVTMCGTPDALYRVVSNYTDGFQSRIAVARTPDNTFAPLEEKPFVLTDKQADRIRQIAHLLPLMQGEVVLPKLEEKGRAWVENVRLETMKNDDRTMARQRMRVCVTAQRMTCCLMLCKVAETLIQKHGMNGAETRLKQQPNLWKEMLLKVQTPQLLDIYDEIADSLIENALHFFRERIENAFTSRDYAGSPVGERLRRTKNDSIFERLDPQFTFEQAMQHTVAVKGASVTRNTVYQILKNWRKQGLIERIADAKFRKL